MHRIRIYLLVLLSGLLAAPIPTPSGPAQMLAAPQVHALARRDPQLTPILDKLANSHLTNGLMAALIVAVIAQIGGPMLVKKFAADSAAKQSGKPLGAAHAPALSSNSGASNSVSSNNGAPNALSSNGISSNTVSSNAISANTISTSPIFDSHGYIPSTGPDPNNAQTRLQRRSGQEIGNVLFKEAAKMGPHHKPISNAFQLLGLVMAGSALYSLLYPKDIILTPVNNAASAIPPQQKPSKP